MKASESLQNDQSTATEKALRRAVDTTPAFIHTGRPDGHLDYFNRGWLDLLGKSVDEVSGWRWTESIQPEDVDGIVQKWRAALASGEPFEAEARVQIADGMVCPDLKNCSSGFIPMTTQVERTDGEDSP